MIETERHLHIPPQEHQHSVPDTTPHLHAKPHKHHDHHEDHSDHEHGAGCGCSEHEGHSHEVLFSEALEQTWGTRFDTVLQASFLLTTKGATYTPEKRLGIESAIRKLEFSPDPRSQTDAEKQMNQAFDSLLTKSPVLEKIKEAPTTTIATTLLNLRKVRFNEDDQQKLQEKITTVSSDEHMHVHADEITLTYDIHAGDNHYSFKYSEALQVIALHIAQEVKGEEAGPEAKTIHSLAHALSEAGVTLANKRSMDNPYVKQHPYALRQGQTLQDFEKALQNKDRALQEFELEDLHELGGIHGEIRMNEQGQLVEDACPEHAQEVDQMLEQLQQETQQEFQQTVNEQSPVEQQEIREPMDYVDDRQFPAGAPAQTEQRSMLDTISRPTTPSLSTTTATAEVQQPSSQTTPQNRSRSRGIPSMPRSNPARVRPSFDDGINRQPSPISITTSQRQEGRQISLRGTSNAVENESEVNENVPVSVVNETRQPIQIREYQNLPAPFPEGSVDRTIPVAPPAIAEPTYVQSDAGIASNVIPFPSLLQAEGTTNRTVQVRSVNTSVSQLGGVISSEPASIASVPNRNQSTQDNTRAGGEVTSVEPSTPSFQIRFTDSPSAVRQDAVQVSSSSSERAPIFLVNPNTSQDNASSVIPEVEEYKDDSESIVVQSVVETPEEPQPVINSTSPDTDLENVVVPPTDEISSFSSDRTLPSTPRPERPPQDPKNTLDNTRTVTRPVAVQRKAPDIVIGSTLSEALEVAERQTTVAQTVAVQEQKEEQVAVTQAIGVQNNEQTTVKSEEQKEAGSGNAPAVSRTNEVVTKEESTETEYTVKTASGTSVRVRQSGITAPTRQGRSTNTEKTEVTSEVEQQATERGTNEEVQKVQATGAPLQTTTPQRTQSNTTRTTATVATSQGAKLELQVDARHIDHNNPVNTRMLFDQMLRQLAA